MPQGAEHLLLILYHAQTDHLRRFVQPLDPFYDRLATGGWLILRNAAGVYSKSDGLIEVAAEGNSSYRLRRSDHVAQRLATLKPMWIRSAHQLVADTCVLDICICTHQPRKDVLNIALRSIARQKIGAQVFRVLIVDSASNPPIDASVLAPLLDAGIAARLVREPIARLSRARFRAIRDTEGSWLLFMDDDNELEPDYVLRGLEFISENPTVGCVGGKLLLPPHIEVPDWVRPFLPYLGIKDAGDATITKVSEEWGPWEPAGAGAWVRHDVADLYADKLQRDPRTFDLGRSGGKGLSSCDDSLMMRGAHQLGLANAYCPALKLQHHIAPHRFKFDYLLPLMAGYGRSSVLLEDALGLEHPAEHNYEDDEAFARLLDCIFTADKSGRLRAAEMAWNLSARQQHLKNFARLSESPLRVTLVTPCLNAAETIERTLMSVEQQKYPALEYIVCDGGSSDATLCILEKYRGLITKLIVEKDKNVADALNKGFAQATGEIRCYLNADDCLMPGALDKVSAAFRRSPDLEVLTGGCQRWFADGTGLVTQVPERYLEVLPLRNDIEQPSTFWRAFVHERAGKFDDTFQIAFDWEFWNRLAQLGACFRRTNKVLSAYYFSDTNLTSRAGAKVIDEMYRVTKRYASDGGRAADLYMELFKEFDMRGFYDGPFSHLPEERQIVFKKRLEELSREYGKTVVENYNWNWASKQVRGLKWY